jgi:hypothetical protein
MTDRERTVFAAVEALVGAALLVGGLLLPVSGLVGLLFAFLGFMAVAQSLAVGLGLATPPADTRKDRDPDGP